MKITLYETVGDKKVVSPELFSEKAEELAKRIAKSENTTSTQIRRFYDEVLYCQGLVKSNPNDWEGIIPLAHMLVAKAKYSEIRGHVCGEFVEFLCDAIKQVNDPESLDILVLFFEATVGFHKFYYEKNKEKQKLDREQSFRRAQ